MKCAICPKVYKTKRGLTNHLLARHKHAFHDNRPVKNLLLPQLPNDVQGIILDYIYHEPHTIKSKYWNDVFYWLQHQIRIFSEEHCWAEISFLEAPIKLLARALKLQLRRRLRHWVRPHSIGENAWLANIIKMELRVVEKIVALPDYAANVDVGAKTEITKWRKTARELLNNYRQPYFSHTYDS